MRGGSGVERRPTAAMRDVELAEQRPLRSSATGNDFYAEDDNEDDTPFCCVPLKIMVVVGVVSLIVTMYSKKKLDEAVG